MADNKTIEVSITKEQVAALPVAEYPGGIRAITVVDTAAKARMALRALKKCTHIGFDTETRPTFQRGGHMHKVALLQLSTGDHCFLFRLTVDGLFDMVKPLLENPGIIKVGLSVHDDYNALRRRGDIDPRGFVDLQDYARSLHIADISLQKIFAIVFGLKISKAQRLTNWEAPELSAAQQTYAAIDAWACLKLYRYFRAGFFKPLQSQYLVTEKTCIVPENNVGHEEQDTTQGQPPDSDNCGAEPASQKPKKRKTKVTA